jgi:hypothetical protein
MPHVQCDEPASWTRGQDATLFEIRSRGAEPKAILVHFRVSKTTKKLKNGEQTPKLRNAQLKITKDDDMREAHE